MTRYSAGQVIELKDYQATQSFLDETLTFAPVPVKEFKDYTFEGPLFDPNSSTRGGYTGDPQRPLPIRAGQPGEVIFWRSWAGEEKKDLPGFFAHGDWVLPGAGNGIFAGKALSGIRVSIDIQYQGTHKPGDSNLAWFTLDVGTLSSLNYKYAPIKQSEDGFKHYGGPNDTWGLDSTTADLGTLRVRITKCTSGGWSQINFYNPKVVVYYTTTSINFNGPAYRSVTYRSQVGGADISDPSQLPPPKATMGDTFQGSLVLNDVTAPSFIRYSLPDQPERFPAPYRMKMGTRRKGKITALKAYKQVLIVGMERAVKRVNYLPKEVDTDFVQGAGLSHEDISATHGIVGPNAITDFDMPGMGPVVAYVSTIGLRVTNGVDSRALNTDVLLKDYVHPDYWSKCILRAFPNQKWLVLYYVPKGSSHGVLSKCLVYSYSEDHIKGGATIVLSGNPPLTGPLPVTGPCDCYVVDACDIVINSSPQVATTDGEYIFIEDSAESETPIRTVTGDDDATKVQRVNVPNIKSRDLFPAGFTQDSNIGSVYLIHETKGSQFVATGATSTKDSTVLYFNTGWGAHTPQVGERVIHGGWDSPPSVLAVGETDITLSAPAVRAFTGDATFDTGVMLVRVNAAQFGEDEVPILTEYRSTSVGVGQAFLMDATANRFSVEIIKTENPNTGDLNDLGEDMSIIGIVYHAASTGETTLHAN
jgi:hypothetical protein